MANKKAKKKSVAKSKPAKSKKSKPAKPRKADTARKPRKSTQKKTSSGRRRTGSGSITQSGDLQGLRNTGTADSESVEELLEEGNAFEADVVAGVEEADDDEEREVHTREVPEDDVPEEYLDKD